MDKNYLGLDWGAAKIGIAIAHAETRLALVYGVWPNDESFFQKLQTLLEQESIGSIVLGVPRYFDTPKGNHPAEVWGRQLEKKVNMPVYFSEEMFTSKLARTHLAVRDTKESLSHDDAEAARIILQDWIGQQP